VKRDAFLHYNEILHRSRADEGPDCIRLNRA
jgi:hypothetical protein